MEKLQKNDLVHDINSSLAALQGALELLNDHWKKDPDLIHRIIPVTIKKLEVISEQITQFHHHSNNS